MGNHVDKITPIKSYRKGEKFCLSICCGDDWTYYYIDEEQRLKLIEDLKALELI